MKKLSSILFLLLLLTGCGKNEVSGEVQSVTQQGAYIELSIVGKETPILADEKTYVYSFANIEEGLLSGDLIRPHITAHELTKTRDGYYARQIRVDSVLLPEPYILKDGTKLNVRRHYNHTAYMTSDGLVPDGIVLLDERNPIGPENVHVGGLPSLIDLTPEAQGRITAYYKDLGLLYDLDTELEKAYQRYLETDEKNEFQAGLVSQDIGPTAVNDQLIWYCASVTVPLNGNVHQETRNTTIFDRKTGTVVDISVLFTCSETEVGATLLAASGIQDTKLRQEMEAAFRLEYLNFHSTALDICFPAGSLPSEYTAHLIGVDYAEIKQILHSWAIPDSLQ